MLSCFCLLFDDPLCQYLQILPFCIMYSILSVELISRFCHPQNTKIRDGVRCIHNFSMTTTFINICRSYNGKNFACLSFSLGSIICIDVDTNIIYKHMYMEKILYRIFISLRIVNTKYQINMSLFHNAPEFYRKDFEIIYNFMS